MLQLALLGLLAQLGGEPFELAGPILQAAAEERIATGAFPRRRHGVALDAGPFGTQWCRRQERERRFGFEIGEQQIEERQERAAAAGRAEAATRVQAHRNAASHERRVQQLEPRWVARDHRHVREARAGAGASQHRARDLIGPRFGARRRDHLDRGGALGRGNAVLRRWHRRGDESRCLERRAPTGLFGLDGRNANRDRVRGIAAQVRQQPALEPIHGGETEHEEPPPERRRAASGGHPRSLRQRRRGVVVRRFEAAR